MKRDREDVTLTLVDVTRQSYMPLILPPDLPEC